MSQAYLALGGNLGQVAETIRWASEQLSAHDQIHDLQTSGLYETAAVGGQAGAAFLNAAIRCQTSLSPDELLAVCQSLEDAAGRVRQLHWGPRTLDVDIVGCDDLIVEHPQLMLPHPAAWYRRFVLDPLAEVAADWIVPGRGLTVKQLRDRLRVRPLTLLVSSPALQQDAVLEPVKATFSSAEISIVCALNRADESTATWNLIDPQADPQLWEAADVHNRCHPGISEAVTAEGLIWMVRAALDEPLRLA